MKSKEYNPEKIDLNSVFHHEISEDTLDSLGSVLQNLRLSLWFKNGGFYYSFLNFNKVTDIDQFDESNAYLKNLPNDFNASHLIEKEYYPFFKKIFIDENAKLHKPSKLLARMLAKHKYTDNVKYIISFTHNTVKKNAVLQIDFLKSSIQKIWLHPIDNIHKCEAEFLDYMVNQSFESINMTQNLLQVIGYILDSTTRIHESAEIKFHEELLSKTTCLDDEFKYENFIFSKVIDMNSDLMSSESEKGMDSVPVTANGDGLPQKDINFTTARKFSVEKRKRQDTTEQPVQGAIVPTVMEETQKNKKSKITLHLKNLEDASKNIKKINLSHENKKVNVVNKLKEPVGAISSAFHTVSSNENPPVPYFMNRIPYLPEDFMIDGEPVRQEDVKVSPLAGLTLFQNGYISTLCFDYPVVVNLKNQNDYLCKVFSDQQRERKYLTSKGAEDIIRHIINNKSNPMLSGVLSEIATTSIPYILLVEVQPLKQFFLLKFCGSLDTPRFINATICKIDNIDKLRNEMLVKWSSQHHYISDVDTNEQFFSTAIQPKGFVNVYPEILNSFISPLDYLDSYVQQEQKPSANNDKNNASVVRNSYENLNMGVMFGRKISAKERVKNLPKKNLQLVVVNAGNPLPVNGHEVEVPSPSKRKDVPMSSPAVSSILLSQRELNIAFPFLSTFNKSTDIVNPDSPDSVFNSNLRKLQIHKHKVSKALFSEFYNTQGVSKYFVNPFVSVDFDIQSQPQLLSDLKFIVLKQAISVHRDVALQLLEKFWMELRGSDLFVGNLHKVYLNAVLQEQSDFELFVNIHSSRHDKAISGVLSCRFVDLEPHFAFVRLDSSYKKIFVEYQLNKAIDFVKGISTKAENITLTTGDVLKAAKDLTNILANATEELDNKNSLADDAHFLINLSDASDCTLDVSLEDCQLLLFSSRQYFSTKEPFESTKSPSASPASIVSIESPVSDELMSIACSLQELQHCSVKDNSDSDCYIVENPNHSKNNEAQNLLCSPIKIKSLL